MPNIKKGDIDFSKANFRKDFDHFHQIYTEEPHFSRRTQILQKYPEIKNLYVKEWRTIPILIAILIAHFTIVYYAPLFSWPIQLCLAYFGSATFIHMVFIINHDVTHFTAVNSIQGNLFLSALSSISTGFPYGLTFGNYHREHHKFQGYKDKDTDLPSDFEVKFFRNSFLKFVWILLIPFFYTMRPQFLMPQKLGPREQMNVVFCIVFDMILYYFMGLESMKFLLVSVYLSLSVHPMAIHFISEHLEFLPGQETYSYYGPWNYLMFNVGYHNEHHDFPMIPWSKLPQLHEMCKEFYDMPSHKSYLRVWYEFLFNDNVGLWSRIERKEKKE